MKPIRIFLIGCLWATACLDAAAQDTGHKIDSLFRFVKPGDPGYIVGVIHNGKLAYNKGFGLADLEHRVPMSDSAAFYMGSTSKQFTAACLLWLVDKGKVSVADNIRKYLPEMPDYGHTITIADLLHHTSGIREYTSLMLFAGNDPNFEGLFTNDDAYKLMRKQRALNFTPGTEHNYSSGGYILIAKIIEKISGISLRKFADSVLFRPLGMRHTFFDDQHDEWIANRVQSYYPTGSGYRQYLKAFDMVGDGGLVTALVDLAKWDDAFYSDRLGIADFAEKMGQRFKLANGRMLTYAWGIYNDTFKGLRTLQHGGFMLGYDSDILRFPDQHLTIIVLNNARGRRWSTDLAYTIADICLSGQEKHVTRPIPAFKTLKSGSVNKKSFAGTYWNLEHNYYNRVDWKSDTLYFDNTNGFRVAMLAIGKEEYVLKNTGIRIYFMGKKMYLADPASPNPDEVFEKYDPAPPKGINDIRPLAGTYYSPELNIHYTIKIMGNTAFLTIGDRPPVQIYPASGNMIWNSKHRLWIGFAEITFTSEGLSVGDSRVREVTFKRIN